MDKTAMAGPATNPNPLLSRFSDFVPVLVAASRAVLFETNLMHAYAVLLQHPEGRNTLAGVRMDSSDDDFWPGEDEWWADYRPYDVKDGILSIPVRGVLLNNFSFQLGSYATGYTYLRRAFDRGMADSSVQGIALVIDSPGGEVAGNFDLVDHLYAGRGEKPIRSMAAGDACSAAYSIASAGDSISMTRDSEVGSIGVYTSHMDMSKYLERVGLTITLIDAPEGGHKVDGNPYQPLPKDVKDRIQGRINEIYGVFVSTVARNRSMDAKPIRDTQALCLGPAEALAAGLADSVDTFQNSMAAFAASLQGGPLMADVKEADHQRLMAEATATATKNAQAAAQARIGGILSADEVKGREALAQHLAFKTEMSVDDAKAMLAVAPKEAAAATPPAAAAAAPPAAADLKAPKSQDQLNSEFEKFMNTSKHPNLHQEGDGEDGTSGEGKGSATASILKNYAAHGGRVLTAEEAKRLGVQH